MKKIIFIIVLLSEQLISNAQITQGRIVVGTSIFYQNQQTINYDPVGNRNGAQTTYNNFTYTLQPGYLITENFCLGISAVYINNTENNQNPPDPEFDSDSKTWLYGIYGRHYLYISEKFYFTNSFVMTLKTGTNNSSNYYTDPSLNTSSALGIKGYYFSYAPGLLYFITPHVGIKTNIGTISYDHTTTTTTSGSNTGTSNTYGIFSILSPLTSFNVGVDFFFGKIGNEPKSDVR